MPDVQRGLAHDQHEPPAFLQAHVGRAREQVRVERVRDRRRRLDRARNHQHAVGLERAARDRRAEIGVAVDDVRQRLEVRARCTSVSSSIVCRAWSERIRCVSISRSARSARSAPYA